MKSVLITGATGDIASSFIKTIDQKQYNLITSSHSSTEVDVNFLSLVSHYESKNHEYDFVLHTASVLCEKRITKKYAENIIKVNILATNALIEKSLSACENITWIYMSSTLIDNNSSNKDSIFSLFDREIELMKKRDVDFLSYSVSDELLSYVERNIDARELYALSKLYCEFLFRKVRNFIILRLSNSFGPQYNKQRLIPKIVNTLLDGNSIKIENEERNFIYEKTINKFLIQSISGEIRNGIYKFCDQRKISTSKLAKIVKSLLPTCYGSIIVVNSSGETKISITHTSCSLNSDLKIIDYENNFLDELKLTINSISSIHKPSMNNTIPSELVPENSTLLNGSSSAVVLRYEDDGIIKIRKIAYRKGIEGNGYPKLYAEFNYRSTLLERHPFLDSMYMKVIDSGVMGQSFFVDYLSTKNSRNLAELAYSDNTEWSSSDLSDFMCNIIEIWNDNLTLIPQAKKNDKFFAYYCRRVVSRLNSLINILELKPYLSKDEKYLLHVLTSDSICINGKNYISWRATFNSCYREELFPCIECLCVHGDLTLLNLVFDEVSSEIKMVDPRGALEIWDPLYDLSKLKFSISGFSSIITNNYDLSHNGLTSTYRVNYDKNGLLDELNVKFYETLLQIKGFERLISSCPNWKAMLSFYESCHYLSDVLYRFNTDCDPKSSIACLILGVEKINYFHTEVDFKQGEKSYG